MGKSDNSFCSLYLVKSFGGVVESSKHFLGKDVSAPEK